MGGELWHRERVPVEAHSAAGGREDRGRGRRGPRPVGPEVNDGRRERKGWVEGVELAGEAEAEGQLRPPSWATAVVSDLWAGREAWGRTGGEWTRGDGGPPDAGAGEGG